MLDAVILSDIHLGSDNHDVAWVSALLRRIAEGDLATFRLILNGGAFASARSARLERSHWNVLSQLHELSGRMDIVWLCGEDGELVKSIAGMLGVCPSEEFILDSGGERVLVLPGHVFDKTALKVKRGTIPLLPGAEQARVRAWNMGCTVVCCGHAHQAVANPNRLVGYFNSGCCSGPSRTILTVGKGVVSLHHFRVDSTHSSCLDTPKNGIPLRDSAMGPEGYISTFELVFPDAHMRLMAMLAGTDRLPALNHLEAFYAYVKAGSSLRKAALALGSEEDEPGSGVHGRASYHIRELNALLGEAVIRTVKGKGRPRSELTGMGLALAEWIALHPEFAGRAASM
jgi:predicted phosphodiesterase